MSRTAIGVIGHARTGLLVAQAPDNEDERILAVAKSNPGRMPASLRFALAQEEGACPLRHSLVGRRTVSCQGPRRAAAQRRAWSHGPDLPGLPSADAQTLQHAGQEREGGVRRRRLQRANDRTGGQQTPGGFEAEVRHEHVGAAGRRHVTPIRTRPLNAVGEKVDFQARNRGNCRKRYSPSYSPSDRQLASSCQVRHVFVHKVRRSASGNGCQMKYLTSTPVGAAQLGAAS
jgi:hypothetical protein